MSKSQQVCFACDNSLPDCDCSTSSDKLIEQQQTIIANLESELTAVKHENHALATWKDKTEALAASVVMCQGTIQDKTMTEMLKISAEHDAEVARKAIIDAIDAHKNHLLTFDFDTAIRVTDLIKYADSVFVEMMNVFNNGGK